MKNLIAKVPELQLKHTTAPRTIHEKDNENPAYAGIRSGTVVNLDIVIGPDGRQWTKADIELYIKCRDIDDQMARGEYIINGKHSEEYLNKEKELEHA